MTMPIFQKILTSTALCLAAGAVTSCQHNPACHHLLTGDDYCEKCYNLQAAYSELVQTLERRNFENGWIHAYTLKENDLVVIIYGSPSGRISYKAECYRLAPGDTFRQISTIYLGESIDKPHLSGDSLRFSCAVCSEHRTCDINQDAELSCRCIEP